MTKDTEALREAEAWLRACSDWMLTNDLDMQVPDGVLDNDPLNIADRLAVMLRPVDAAEDTSKVKVPFAHCCAEGGGRVDYCDCANKYHGTAWVDARAASSYMPTLTPDTIGSHFGNGGEFDPESAVAPVAYRYVHRNYAGQKINIYGDHPVRVNGALPEETHPLYAHPPHPAPVDPVAGWEALREKVARIIADGSHGDPWWWKAAFDDGREEIAVRLREDDLALACTILAALKGPAA